jgi:hypothetical protein
LGEIIYPEDFPIESQAAVTTERLRASRDYDSARNSIPSANSGGLRDLEGELRKYILRPFLIFVCEASKLGYKGVWSADRIDSESREFLRRSAVRAKYDKAHDRSGSAFADYWIENWGGNIVSSVMRKLERHDEWKQFEAVLLDVAERQAAGTTRPSLTAEPKDKAHSETQAVVHVSEVAESSCGPDGIDSSVQVCPASPIEDAPKSETELLLEYADALWIRATRGPQKALNDNIAKIHQLNLMSHGRAIERFRIHRDYLEAIVEVRLHTYRSVAEKVGSRDMFSAFWVSLLRSRIEHTVKFGIQALRDQIEQDQLASDEQGSLPEATRYLVLESDLLSMADTELNCMKAEGRIHGGIERGVPEVEKPKRPSHVEVINPVRADTKTKYPASQQKANGWPEIEITFVSDERVQISLGSHIKTLNYAEFGFADRRSGKPNQQWCLLRTLAQQGGIIRNLARDARQFVAFGKRVERLRDRLKKHFEVSTDPLVLKPESGYTCQFKINCARSFEM